MTKDFRIWALRIAWIALPFTAGDIFDNALSLTSRSVQITATVGLWFCWAVGLLLSLIPLASLLTPFRVLAAMKVVVIIWGAIEASASPLGIIALSISGIIVALSLTPQVGFWYINGSSYGDEVRLPLRPPGAMLLGPSLIAWAGIATTLIGTPILLADKQWIAGSLIGGFGGICSYVSFRSLHVLAQRWLVFVPAGVVIHDPLILADPFLVKRKGIRSLRLALSGSTSKDLTMGSLGHAIEVELAEASEIALQSRPDVKSEFLTVSSFTVSPSLASVALLEAESRSIPN
ncbi:MAG: hypothetical protein VYB80_05365 [Actinomycetota bacterium]|nr:hypothetical protein [Actinomycetota bacterium]